MRGGFTDAYGNGDGNAHSYGHANSDSSGYSDGNSNSDGDANTDAYGYGNSDLNADSNWGETVANAAAASNITAAAPLAGIS